jgi:hypothetical protein
MPKREVREIKREVIDKVNITRCLFNVHKSILKIWTDKNENKKFFQY